MFDMDGTLVQTRYASWEIFEGVNRRFGLGVDTPEAYYELFRSNVFGEIEKRCTDAEQYRAVKTDFLAALRSGYHPVMIPGMLHVVRRLASVATLALLSSNALPVMRRILVDNDLAFCFAHVFGGDTVPDKRTAIRQFLADTGSGFGRRCSADYDEAMVPVEVAAEGTVLVTDTAGDVREAVEEGIRAVGVAWGMHSVDQLLDAGAEFVALWPQEVGSYLLQGIDAAPRGACELPPRTGEATALCAGTCGGSCDGRCGGTCSGACTSCPAGSARPGPEPADRAARRLLAAQGLLAAATAAPPPPGPSPDPSPSSSLSPAARRTPARGRSGADRTVEELTAAVARICR
ncbi:MAG: HAD family hydrolase [Actinobacteria bacterium]|nr:HAD family hydrolase [Actinomycetota bacterium]